MALSATPAVAIEFDAGTWTDVSAHVRGATTRRGRAFELDQFAAGRATVTLNNRTRLFDPEHTTGTYYGKLLPRKRIRIGFTYAATTYWKFYGYIDGWPQSYDGPNDSTVTVSATDAFKVFAGAKVPSVWEQEVRALAPQTWWRLGESSGTVMADSSGNRHHGVYENRETFNSRASLVAGDTDTAIEFSGSTGATLSLSDHPGAVMSYPFSVTFVTNAAALPASPPATGPVFWQQHDRSDGTGGFMTIQSAGSAGVALGAADEGLLVLFNDGEGNKRNWYTTAVFDGTIHVVTVTVTDAATVSVYVDGVNKGAAVYSTSGSAPTPQGGTGRQVIGNALNNTMTLDEVVLFDSAIDVAVVDDDLHSAALTPWVGDTPKARLARVLDYIGWPAADRDLDTGSAILVAAQLEGFALEHLQAVELSEGGRLFIDRTGRVALVGRQNAWTEALYNTSNATFGDSGSELKYRATRGDLFGLDDEKIVNDASVRQFGGSEQVATDATSQTAYGVMTRSESTLESRPGVVADRADYLVYKYKDPALRMPKVEIKPERSPTTLYALIGANDLGYRYTFKRRPQAVGSAISKEFHVEAEALVIAPDDITVTWELSPAEPAFWILNTSTLETDSSIARIGY